MSGSSSVFNEYHGKSIILLLGSNVGERLKALGEAEKSIDRRIGRVLMASSVYESKAWGLREQSDFLNKALSLQSELSPTEVLDEILGIERGMGRIRDRPMGPRIIDIDIIFIGDCVISNERLTVPHPLMQLRKFVLQPVSEIASGFIHPILGKSISDLLKVCPDDVPVWKYSP